MLRPFCDLAWFSHKNWDGNGLIPSHLTSKPGTDLFFSKAAHCFCFKSARILNSGSFWSMSMVTVIVGLSLSVQVRNLSITHVDHTRLDMTWAAPDVTSDATNTAVLRYSVSCVTCRDNITFIPARSGLSNTRLFDFTMTDYFVCIVE